MNVQSARGFVPSASLSPEAIEGDTYNYSRTSLAFDERDIERQYHAYRNPRIVETLRWLLGVAAVLVFGGSLIDFSRQPDLIAWELTAVRVVVCVGMLAALAMTLQQWVINNLQLFIMAGSAAIHVVWWGCLLLIGPQIAAYDGVLQLNILLTFLVSGLMFRKARVVAGFAMVAYIIGLLWQHPDPVSPILYLVISGFYAGFAAYVAERARRDAWAESQALEEERRRSDSLLLNVLPRSIADRKKRDQTAIIADKFDEAAVLFADIVGFTKMSAKMAPEDLVVILNDIFTRFDRIAKELELEKIKTIGDCYMLACGLPDDRSLKPDQIAEAALRMQEELAVVASSFDDEIDADLQIRIGIHCGPVVAGVIGEAKFIYDLWGDTVNTASRMESTAEDGKIQISAPLCARLSDRFEVENIGKKAMKGKAEQEVWLLHGRA